MLSIYKHQLDLRAARASSPPPTPLHTQMCLVVAVQHILLYTVIILCVLPSNERGRYITIDIVFVIIAVFENTFIFVFFFKLFSSNEYHNKYQIIMINLFHDRNPRSNATTFLRQKYVIYICVSVALTLQQRSRDSILPQLSFNLNVPLKLFIIHLI